MNINVIADRLAGAETTSLEDAGLIKLAVLAVGGQGGGVLTNWIVDLAQSNGFTVQATSVPGVAQRTGATIYYVEMLPATDQAPVLALMPMPGDVDIVVAAEIMEAGRTVTRGIVTPDRTTLIASTHRMYAVAEKIVPGDGIVPSQAVSSRLVKAAKHLICHDLSAIAERHGAHISASLFGASPVPGNYRSAASNSKKPFALPVAVSMPALRHLVTLTIWPQVSPANQRRRSALRLQPRRLALQALPPVDCS